MPRHSSGERTAVCLTAGRDYGTRGTDAQVTTLPGEEAITPSQTEALFSICCEAHSAKPVISRLKTSAVWRLVSFAFCGIHQYTPVSVHTIKLHWAISQMRHLFLGVSLRCFTRQDVLSLGTFVPRRPTYSYYMSLVITSHPSRYSKENTWGGKMPLPLAARVFVLPANCKVLWIF